MEPGVNLIAILPQTIVLVTAILVLLLGLFWSNSRGLGIIGLIGVVAACVLAVVTMRIGSPEPASFGNMALADHFSFSFTLIISLATALALLLSLSYAERLRLPSAEYYGLLLLSAAGMMFMGTANNLVTLFLSLEIFSISLYVLVGLNRKEITATEAAMKYFLLGGFASGFLLYGMALVYGATGSLAFPVIFSTIPQAGPWNGLLLAGIGLILVGFGFKVAAVPFHMWTPDVYQGAPTSITAFMAVGAKAAGFAALLRLLLFAFPALYSVWVWPVAALAVLTMTWGNLAALGQMNVKRMLAYSSIAHAGYLLVGVAAGNAGLGGVQFYLVAYALMNLGAFAVLIALERSEGESTGVSLDRLRGLFSRHPWLAAAMTLFMLSLAGMPPLVGFLGKLYVFSAAIESGLMWLAIVGVVNSVISAYYYLRVIARMALSQAEEEEPLTPCPALAIGTALAALGTVVAGLWPSPLLSLLVGTAGILFGG